MAYDLGGIVPMSISIYDADGAPADAGAVALTVTLPDATTATPVITHTETGVYEANYATTQAGLHQLRWVASGANAGAFVDVFDVSSAPVQIVSIADAKRHLNITATGEEEELRSFIEAATLVIEQHVGKTVARRPRTEVVESSGGVLMLSHPPVISLTSLTPIVTGGTTHEVALLDVDGPSGVVRLLDGGCLTGGPFRATYTAGMAQVPVNYINAAKMIIAHMWETQRNTSGRRPAFSDAESVYDPRTGFAVPRRALELLGPRRPLVA